MAVADLFLPFSLFYSFGVILLITKYIRGFWFHILELVSWNYPSRGTTLEASLIPPRLIAGLWQEQLERWLCMQGTVEANEILLQASKLPQQCFDIHLTPREENAKGKRSSTSMETANQANEGKEQRKERRLRDRGTEYKSKTDLMFHCLVCHGTMAALNPTPAILCDFSPLLPLLLSNACFCFASPVVGSGIPAQWGPYNWEPCLLFSPLPPTSSPFHFFPPLISSLFPPLNIWTGF